jgi:hypothetical protein
MVDLCPLLGNGCVFYGSASRLYKYASRKSGVSCSKRTRMERVLVICEVSRSAIIDCE